MSFKNKSFKTSFFVGLIFCSIAITFLLAGMAGLGFGLFFFLPLAIGISSGLLPDLKHAVLGTLFIVLLDNLFVPLIEDQIQLLFNTQAGDIQSLIFGLIMFLFIIFQPMGLYGMWLKMRIYWKLFPFNPRQRFT